MKEIVDLREKQKIAIDVLFFFDDFCREHSIDYMLAYGTLLGAVRHKGVIPWDDDVDIMMTRNQYFKFISLYKDTVHPYYKFLSMHTNQDYFAPLAKLYDDRTLLIQGYGQDERIPYGIYIDIFIIDKLPQDIPSIREFYKHAQKLRFLWAMSVKKFSARSSSCFRYIMRLPILLLAKCIGFRFFLKKYDDYASMYFKQNNSKYAGVVIYGESGQKEINLLSEFLNFTKVSFEGREFNAPHDVHKYLTQMYGDYMQIPPEKDRKVHPNIAYWK